MLDLVYHLIYFRKTEKYDFIQFSVPASWFFISLFCRLFADGQKNKMEKG